MDFFAWVELSIKGGNLLFRNKFILWFTVKIRVFNLNVVVVTSYVKESHRIRKY